MHEQSRGLNFLAANAVATYLFWQSQPSISYTMSSSIVVALSASMHSSTCLNSGTDVLMHSNGTARHGTRPHLFKTSIYQRWSTHAHAHTHTQSRSRTRMPISSATKRSFEAPPSHLVDRALSYELAEDTDRVAYPYPSCCEGATLIGV